MGYMKHNTIVVTSFDEKEILVAHACAKELFNKTTPTYHDMSIVSEVITSTINGYYSFFVAPDGSKEGWEDSNLFDTNRRSFIKFLEENASNCDFLDAAFGGDDNAVMINASKYEGN